MNPELPSGWKISELNDSKMLIFGPDNQSIHISIDGDSATVVMIVDGVPGNVQQCSMYEVYDVVNRMISGRHAITAVLAYEEINSVVWHKIMRIIQAMHELSIPINNQNDLKKVLGIFGDADLSNLIEGMSKDDFVDMINFSSIAGKGFFNTRGEEVAPKEKYKLVMWQNQSPDLIRTIVSLQDSGVNINNKQEVIAALTKELRVDLVNELKLIPDYIYNNYMSKTLDRALSRNMTDADSASAVADAIESDIVHSPVRDVQFEANKPWGKSVYNNIEIDEATDPDYDNEIIGDLKEGKPDIDIKNDRRDDPRYPKSRIGHVRTAISESDKVNLIRSLRILAVAGFDISSRGIIQQLLSMSKSSIVKRPALAATVAEWDIAANAAIPMAVNDLSIEQEGELLDRPDSVNTLTPENPTTGIETEYIKEQKRQEQEQAARLKSKIDIMNQDIEDSREKILDEINKAEGHNDDVVSRTEGGALKFSEQAKWNSIPSTEEVAAVENINAEQSSKEEIAKRNNSKYVPETILGMPRKDIKPSDYPQVIAELGKQLLDINHANHYRLTEINKILSNTNSKIDDIEEVANNARLVEEVNNMKERGEEVDDKLQYKYDTARKWLILLKNSDDRRHALSKLVKDIIGEAVGNMVADDGSPILQEEQDTIVNEQASMFNEQLDRVLDKQEYSEYISNVDSLIKPLFDQLQVTKTEKQPHKDKLVADSNRAARYTDAVRSIKMRELNFIKSMQAEIVKEQKVKEHEKAKKENDKNKKKTIGQYLLAMIMNYNKLLSKYQETSGDQFQGFSYMDPELGKKIGTNGICAGHILYNNKKSKSEDEQTKHFKTTGMAIGVEPDEHDPRKTNVVVAMFPEGEYYSSWNVRDDGVTISKLSIGTKERPGYPSIENGPGEYNPILDYNKIDNGEDEMSDIKDEFADPEDEFADPEDEVIDSDKVVKRSMRELMYEDFDILASVSMRILAQELAQGMQPTQPANQEPSSTDTVKQNPVVGDYITLKNTPTGDGIASGGDVTAVQPDGKIIIKNNTGAETFIDPAKDTFDVAKPVGAGVP